MKTKTTMNYYFTPTRMATIIKKQNQTKTKSWEHDTSRNWSPPTLLEGTNIAALWNIRLAAPQKLTQLRCDPVTPQQGPHPREEKNTSHRNLYTSVPSCMIPNSPKGNQPKYHTQNVAARLLIKKYPHTKIFFSHMK